ncbi:MAG: SusC/RagA family TonB-linked outer membrane protein [Bacteroidetes bacterium]|nr:SusC/RagA family TonB-linked outer membrane protein [Bacteroidota bacterium]
MKLLNKEIYLMCGLILFMLLLILPAANLKAQNKADARKQKSVVVNLKVTNEKGEPFPGAGIILGEGLVHTETGATGTVVLTIHSDKEYVTITSPGYEPQVLLISELTGTPTVKMVKSKLYMTTDDDVNLPYLTMKKRYLTGSTSVLDGVALDRYPSTDIRNALTGLVTGMEVRELNGSPGLSAEEKLGKYGASEKVGLYSRGTSLMYIIDNVRMDITEMPLDPGEIESVSLVRDIVSKTMYGPAAANGIVFIKTKRGKKNERLFNVNLEQGVSTIDRLPEWVSGADYARLNNLAKTNSGITTGLYSDDDIAAYALNDPYDMNHPSVNYQDLLLKKTRAFTRANVSTSGGTDAMQYSAYIGYNGEGDNYNMGKNAGYKRINARSNLDIRINNYLKVQMNFFAGISLYDSPNYGYASTIGENGTEMGLTEMPSLLEDITNIPPIAFPIYINNDPSLKSPWYGISSSYGTNPVGNLVKNGYYNESGRSGGISSLFEWNMGNILPGLKSRTFVDFNTFYLLRIGKAENYTAYRIDPRTYDPALGIASLTKAWDGVDATSYVNLHDFYFQNYAAYESLSYDKKFGSSYLMASATYRMSSIKRNGFEEPQREQAGIFTALYSFNDKYIIQGVLNYGGTSGLPAGQEYSLSPSVGLGWIVSEENFMKNLTFLNYMKLRGEYGNTAVDEFRSPFLYRDRWNIETYTGNPAKFGTYYGTTGNWIGVYKQSANNYRTFPNRIGNPEIELERRREFNVGTDALMLKNKLSLEFNYYNILRYNVITTRNNTTPIISGTTSTLPAVNYNSYSYSGVEIGLTFNNKIGGLRYTIGANAFTQKPIIEKIDEPNYRNDYQKTVGGPSDGIRGLKYLGRFETDAEANLIPQFGEDLHAGDLKYEDKNNDGVVDDNDAQLIGHTTPKLYYALNLNLKYKNVELTVIGAGRAFYDVMLNNKYFTNGSGDNIYSKFVLENIDKNGMGGAYPKLTYYQITNNFKTSNFRLSDGAFFKIQNIELAYNLPVQNFEWMKGIRGFRIFARGANVFTLSKIKDVEPENINAGVTTYPLNRTISGGVKLTF